MTKFMTPDGAFAAKLTPQLVFKSIGYQNFETVSQDLQEQMESLINSALKVCRAQILYIDSQFKTEENATVRLKTGERFTSSLLSKCLQNCDGLIVGLITLGKQLDDLIAEVMAEDVLAAYFLDAIGSLIVELAGNQFWCQISEELGEQNMKTTSFISPGFDGFDLAYQRQIFDLLKPEQIGVELTDSYLMVPAKSLTLIMGYGRAIVGAKDGHDCSICGMANCQMRTIGREKDGLN